ncbi:hypothetical protein Tco_1177482, partial [Tanacetum coccineum]
MNKNNINSDDEVEEEEEKDDDDFVVEDQHIGQCNMCKEDVDAKDSCTRNKEHALTLSWEWIPRLASGVRGKMGRDTIQLEDTVSTISQEDLLEFSSEYFIPENLHPELPGPEDHIVDFPEGKIGVYTNPPSTSHLTISLRHPRILPNPPFATIGD